MRTSLRTLPVRTVFELLQHLLQASCYKAKRRISLLTDLLTRVLLTDAILRYWKKQAFTVETDWQPSHWQPKESISDATLSRFKRAWVGQLARISNPTKITKLKSEVCQKNRHFAGNSTGNRQLVRTKNKAFRCVPCCVLQWGMNNRASSQRLPHCVAVGHRSNRMGSFKPSLKR